jgi:hypothetical protein
LYGKLDSSDVRVEALVTETVVIDVSSDDECEGSEGETISAAKESSANTGKFWFRSKPVPLS